MTSDPEKRCRELEEKLRILALENDELAERSEETLLLGLFAEKLSLVKNSEDLVDRALEQIALLKDIPLTICCQLQDDSIRVLNAYSPGEIADLAGREIVLQPQLLEQLEEGAVYLEGPDCRQVEFPSGCHRDRPCRLMLIPLEDRSGRRLVFLFCDDQPETRLQNMRFLLHRIVDSLGVRLDNLLLLGQLTRLNRELDQKVLERTEDLEVANTALRQEIKDRREIERELRKSQDQLNQAQKMEAVGRLAGGIAHDFNNILTAIAGHVELALMGLTEGDPLTEDIQAIQEAADRAAGLTRQLLSFSRKSVMDLKVIDPGRLIQGITKMLTRMIGEDIDLVLELEAATGGILADTSRLEQVLLNLVVNARDAMPDGGRLTIKTSIVDPEPGFPQPSREGYHYSGRFLRLAVSDTGGGIPKGILGSIFDPFFTTKESEKGTGLGLSMVYGIARQHEGLVRVRSEEGKGSTFEVFFPEVTEKGEAAAPVAVQKNPTGTECILLVEDDRTIREVIARILTRLGYTVLSAEDGKQALDIADQLDEPLHLLLTDVVMPGIKGPDLAVMMKDRFPELKIAFMSGYTDDFIGRQGVLESGTHFLQKPISLPELAASVRRALDD